MEKRERRLGRIGEGKAYKGTLYFADEYVAAEQNLETIGYFSAGYKRRYPKEPNEAKVINIGPQRQIRIVPSTYGYPNSEDQDYYRGFLKVCSTNARLAERKRERQITRHPHLELPIGFSTNQLLRYSGKGDNARNRQAVRNWIKRCTATTIEGGLYQAKTKYINQEFGGQLFSQYVLIGEKMLNGREAGMNYVWPAAWFLSNFYYHYYRRVDLAFHQRLSKPIAKGLYPLLETGWFASGGPFTKRYADLCAHLFIQPHAQQSLVKQQLDPAHEELKHELFLEAWEYVLDSEQQWTGVIRWWPGKKWLDDQEARKLRKDLAEQPPDIPGGLAIFSEKKYLTVSNMVNMTASAGGPVSPSHADRVREFYARLGQSKVSKQKVADGAQIITDLEAQGFSLEEVDKAMQWTIASRQKLGDQVYSLGILPHIIGQALQEFEKDQRIEKKRSKQGAEDRLYTESRARSQSLEQLLQSLPLPEQETLREEAIKSLVEQGYDEKLLRVMKSMVKQEVYRLLQAQLSQKE